MHITNQTTTTDLTHPAAPHPRIAPTTMLYTACVLWFVNLPMTVFTSMLFPFYIFSAHDNTPESMTALW